jgi:hypothetical protein
MLEIERQRQDVARPAHGQTRALKIDAGNRHGEERVGGYYQAFEGIPAVDARSEGARQRLDDR